MKDKKAPGLNDILSERLKFVFKYEPDLLLRICDTYLKTGVSQTTARLVVISNGKGDLEASLVYYLNMLDTGGGSLRDSSNQDKLTLN